MVRADHRGGPQQCSLHLKVYQRSYSNALVLYKPLSYRAGVGTGTAADNTVTTHVLNGNYRMLRNDGTLGPVITSITLRNGEGAILILRDCFAATRVFEGRRLREHPSKTRVAAKLGKCQELVCAACRNCSASCSPSAAAWPIGPRISPAMR